MRRNKKSTKVRNASIAALLLVCAGVGGYAASGYFDHQTASDNTSTAQTIQPAPEVKPDTKACIAALPADVKFGQKLMFAVYSDQAAQIAPALAELGIGGVIIMDETSTEQIAQLKTPFKIAPTIAVDQEGGTVQRYKSQGILPGASSMPNLGLDAAYSAYLKDSQYLASLGITTNFAPVVDVESRTVSPLPGRIYSGNPETVAQYAGKAIEAMKAADLQPVIKHFPGLGSASGNTDFVSATTDPFLMLEGRDLVPYKNLASTLPDVMVGNMIVPGLTNNQPAIWSPEAITLLRQLGYQNAVVYSDSITAEAIPGTIEDATTKAWNAGIDTVVIVQERQEIASIASFVQAIVALGNSQLSSNTMDQAALNDSVGRILNRKAIDPCAVASTQ